MGKPEYKEKRPLTEKCRRPDLHFKHSSFSAPLSHAGPTYELVPKLPNGLRLAGDAPAVGQRGEGRRETFLSLQERPRAGGRDGELHTLSGEELGKTSVCPIWHGEES